MQMQLQNTKHGSGEDVTTFLQRAKLIADELAAAGAPMLRQIFNATIYNNLGPDYGQAVTALAVRKFPVTFEELQEIMTSHEIRLRMQQPVILANQTQETPVTFDRSVKSMTNRDGGRSGSRGRGSGDHQGGGGRSAAQPWRDPYLVCGVLGHNPYKSQYRVQPVQSTSAHDTSPASPTSTHYSPNITE